MQGIAQGLERPEICRVMGISPKTYDTYRTRITRKLHAENGLHAMYLWGMAEDRKAERTVNRLAEDLLKAVYSIAQEKLRRA